MNHLGFRTSGLKHLLRFCRDDQGVTFVEVLVTFVMLVAAVVVTAQSVFFGDRALDVNMHKQQVLRIVQVELEYWIGVWYNNQRENEIAPWPTDLQMQGSTSKPYKTVPLEPGSPIEVDLYRDPTGERFDPSYVNELGELKVAYYVITIWAEWEEPDGQVLTVSLTSYSQKPG